MVRFPESLVQKCVEKLGATSRRASSPKRMAVRYSRVRFRKEPFTIHPDFTVSAGGYCVFIYDLDGVRRRATLQDTRDSLKLAAQLDQIAYTGLSGRRAGRAAADPAGAHGGRTRQDHGQVRRHRGADPFDIEYILRIGEVVRGGREELRKRPILVGYAEAKTPLTLDQNMCEVMIEYVKRGMPQSLDTMPNAGATAPMHPAGALAVGLAETLGGLVLCLRGGRERGGDARR